MEVQGKRYAIIIGIEDYADENIDDVRYAENDAIEVYNLLLEAEQDGYEKENVELILNKDATIETLGTKIRETFEKIYSQDSLLIFFARHGDYTSIGGYILPADYRKGEEITVKGYPISNINRFCHHRRPKNFIFFFDSCHSGSAVGEINLGYARGDQAMRLKMQEQIIESASGEGRVIITSCMADELSWGFDELRNGVFTHYLLEGLRGKADQNADGHIDVDELYSYVYENVVDYARNKGIKQNPVKNGFTQGKFYLPCHKKFTEGPSRELRLGLVECPICGGQNWRRETFRCRMCGTNYICKRHLVALGSDKWVCSKCATNDKERQKFAESAGLTFLGENVQGHEEYRANKDGSIVVYIPGGEFVMGLDPELGGAEKDEIPRHIVILDAYFIGKYPVTAAQFKKLCEETGDMIPEREHRGWRIWKRRIEWVDNHPIWATYYEAHSYCEWMNGRLPTEAEWEKAARGIEERIYPWGDEAPDENYSSKDRGLKGNQTTLIGREPKKASPYGVMDMCSNVMEWVQDWYAEDYYKNSPTNNPKGPDIGHEKVLRGGTWFDYPKIVRASYRFRMDPAVRFHSGFRLVIPYR
jgi:formylglycine-generating enzyme required for sulfatase activity